MSNYIFLDLDGVLNNTTYLMSVLDEWGLDPKNISVLKKICEDFDCKVVLSSSWRRDFNSDTSIRVSSDDNVEWAKLILKTFKDANINFVGITDFSNDRYLGWDRIGQIRRYIEKHLDKKDKYIIIDDEDIFGGAGWLSNKEKQMHSHFIRTRTACGLTEDAYDKACKIFNK